VHAGNAQDAPASLTIDVGDSSRTVDGAAIAVWGTGSDTRILDVRLRGHGTLPAGMTFFGRAWSEPALLKIAYGFEQATKARKPPKFLSGVETARVGTGL